MSIVLKIKYFLNRLLQFLLISLHDKSCHILKMLYAWNQSIPAGFIFSSIFKRLKKLNIFLLVGIGVFRHSVQIWLLV
jgi:hypothetical protein